MHRAARSLAVLAGIFLLALAPARAADPQNTIYLDLPAGRVVIELLPDLAPKTVAHVKELTRRGFYDGLAFHRVIDGFMAQTGDPRGNGTGGSGQKVKAEFNPAKHVHRTAFMPRSHGADSAGSHLFISFVP